MKRTIAYALPNAIAYLNTCIPCLITCITYLNTLTRLSALGSILYTCIAYLNTWNRLSARPTRLEPESAANQNRARKKPLNFVSQSESSTEKTIQLRQPIRIEYYVTRVVSQSESSITSPESFRLGWKTLLGSGLESARYSLS